MDTKSHKNKIRIRCISGNRFEDSLLHSESDKDHPIAFVRRSISIIGSDREFSSKSSPNEEMSRPPKIPL